MADRVRILVVDDEQDILASMVEYFASVVPGADVVGMADGRQAEAYVREHHPEIVISDYRMPGMNGLELLHLAYEQGALVTMMVTAYPDVDVAAKALNTGHISRFFVKPPEPAEMRRALQSAVSVIQAASQRQRAFARAVMRAQLI